ncbi:MAG: tRNA (adenosine(37)-N6)-dimethylallyltransferase MiaA [Thermoanaerobaculia bacterium]
MPDYLALVGPTASGKSSLAQALAEEIGAEIVNADPFQAYRGFDIGTAKPGPEERARVPHHLVDILDPHEAFSAGEFGRRAAAALDDIRARDRTALVVGGSGFYLEALWRGLAPIPPVPAAVRRSWRERLGAEGLGALFAELERVDPATAARLEPGDRQRVLRALEVESASGRPLSHWLTLPRRPASQLVPRKVGLTLPRTLLYDRIRARMGRMVEEGWVEEVESLLAGGADPSQPAFRAIGYRAVAGVVRGETDLTSALAAVERDTRRYAKRQRTWFRRETDVRWLGAADARPSDLRALLEE